MANDILIGDAARSVGPLKPTGRIHVRGETLAAVSEGLFIESEADVVIIGGHLGQVRVRPASAQGGKLDRHGEPLQEVAPPATTPLSSPAAWVERVSTLHGAVFGCVAVLVAWAAGVPLSVWVFLVPVAGAIAGRLFHAVVGSAIEIAGPRTDHRPAAFWISGMIVVCLLLGCALGANLGPGYLGLSCGILLGTFVGGLIAMIGLMTIGL